MNLGENCCRNCQYFFLKNLDSDSSRFIYMILLDLYIMLLKLDQNREFNVHYYHIKVITYKCVNVSDDVNLCTYSL